MTVYSPKKKKKGYKTAIRIFLNSLTEPGPLVHLDSAIVIS